ncbi:hypothetical protein [Helicobacter anatolicus]|uniref:hypothetical protein n=1 Tax=Helicobacter anatolicus TaxID=2905874 RepID=UPI001E4DC4E4|nr:hypothetical protein [Helicobacter anatolicus]MCE3040279.1 hypothetical protein [Helicobacter anatolicus]
MLNASLLQEEILLELKKSGFKESKENKAMIEAIAKVIITHIQTNAQVQTTGSATNQSGVIL